MLETSAEYKSCSTKIFYAFITITFIILLCTILSSCQYLGLDPKKDINEEFTIGIQKHHEDKSKK